MNYPLLTMPVTALFVIIGLVYLYYSLKLKKKFPAEHNLLTSAATFILWLTAGIIYPLLYPEGAFMQALSTVIIVLITPLFIILCLAIQNSIIKKNPGLLKHRCVEGFNKLFKDNEAKLKITGKDLTRKTFHALPPVLLIIIWVVCNDYFSADLGRSLILTSGYTGLTLFAFLDFIRLSFINARKLNHLLPEGVSRMLARTMKRRELYEPLKVAPLILAMIPILFFPFAVFLSMMLIATLSDGAASVMGHYFGKARFPKKSNKTIVGYVAGALTAFAIVVISFSVLETLPLASVLLLGMVGMSAFFIIDVINSRIDDNILNPLVAGAALGLTYLLIV